MDKMSGLSKDSEILIESLFKKYMGTPIEQLREERRDPFYMDAVATLDEMEKMASEAYWDYVPCEAVFQRNILKHGHALIQYQESPSVAIPSKAEFSLSDGQKWQKVA